MLSGMGFSKAFFCCGCRQGQTQRGCCGVDAPPGLHGTTGASGELSLKLVNILPPFPFLLRGAPSLPPHPLPMFPHSPQG